MNIAAATLFIKVAAVTGAGSEKSMIYINVYQIKFISNKGIKSQRIQFFLADGLGARA